MYQATTRDGIPVIVKIQQNPNFPAAEACSHLQDNGFTWMPAMFHARTGAIWAEHDSYFYSLQRYEKSDVNYKADSEASATTLAEVGRLLRNLHNTGAPSRLLDILPCESFRPQFYDKASDMLRDVRAAAESHAPAAKLTEMIEKQTDAVQRLFTDAEVVGARLQQAAPPMVLTHGDVHLGNILQLSTGRIFLVDWDWVMIGMPEHDLMYFDDAQLEHIMRGYGSDVSINRDGLQYYRLSLMLRAFWFFTSKTLHAPLQAERFHAAEVLSDILDGSEYLKRALSTKD